MEKMITVNIETSFIQLQNLLKLSGLIATGGQAKQQIQSGQVSVNGQICTQRGKKLHSGDTVSFAGTTLTVHHAD